MNLNNYSNEQGLKPITLRGLNNSSPVQPAGNQQPLPAAGQQYTDSVKLNGPNTSANIASRPQVTFDQVGSADNIDAIISNANNIADPAERSAHLRDVYISLLDNDNYVGAVKVINATPTLIYKNAMFKGFIQELVASGSHKAAIALTNSYADTRIRNELKAYITDYLNFNNNDATAAAEAMGDTSFINIAKLKSESILGSVGKFFSGIGNSVTSVFGTPPRAMQLSRNANAVVGKKFRFDFLDGGNLACAYAVSQMLKGIPGLQNVGSAECNTLAKQLSANGFSRVYGTNFSPIKGKVNYQPGDIVFFTRNNKSGYGHVGMVSEVINGVPYMVHNSSSQRAVVKVRLDQYYKTPVAVYRSGG